MGWYGYSNSGTCCCNHTSACNLTVDDFDRPDDTDLDDKWDEVAGNAAVSGNTLLIGTNGSQIIATASNPSGPYTYISVSLKLNSGSSVARVFLGWANASNYLYAQVSTSALTVGQQGGAGGSSTKTISVSPGTVYQLTVCYDGTKLIASINGVQALKLGLTAAGTRHGLGAPTASVTFDNFVARKISEACANCASRMPTSRCNHCQQNEVNQYWAVDVAGVTNGTCSHCERVNGLYLFLNVQAFVLGCGEFFRADELNPCYPEIVSPPDNDLTAYLIPAVDHYLLPLTGTTYNTRFELRATGNADMIWAQDWGTTKVDCLGLDGLTPPLAHADGGCAGGTATIREYLP